VRYRSMIRQWAWSRAAFPAPVHAHGAHETVIDTLGPKADVYRGMAIEEWGALRKRTDVQVAMFTGTISVLLLVLGIATFLTIHDLSAIGVGLLGLGYSWSVFWPLRDRWRAWRSIGEVSLAMPDLNIVPGQLTSCTVHITPRRDATLQEVNLLFEHVHSRSGGSLSAWQVDVPIPDSQLRRGVEMHLDAEIMLPPGVPPSYFDVSGTRQWTITGTVLLTNGSRWVRDYPVMVYPTP